MMATRTPSSVAASAPSDCDGDPVAGCRLRFDLAIAHGLTLSLRPEQRDGSDAELTTRELEILRLLGAGKTNKEIAVELQISERMREELLRVLERTA